MKQIYLTIIVALLCALAGTASATDKTVTYTFTTEKVTGLTNGWRLTFTPSGEQFGTGTGDKTVIIEDITSTTGFTVNLDDGVRLRYSRDTGKMTFSSASAFWLNNQGADNSRFTVSCSDYYIRHVKLAASNGSALSGTGTPEPTSSGQLDVDVDLDKSGGNSSNWQYTANVSSTSSTFGSITLTLSDFLPGSGTSTDPYTIRYATQFEVLANRVNGGEDFEDKRFVLANNIYFPHTTAWNDPESTENNYTPIGGNYNDEIHNYNCFRGTFDGQGYTISGIRIYKNDIYNIPDCCKLGLFGIVGYNNKGTVKRVNLSDARITGYQDIGGIAGSCVSGDIEECTVGADVCIHAPNIDHYFYYYGGIVGANQGDVRRCISRATLTAGNPNRSEYFGGIAGSNNTGTITDCIVIGATIPDVKARGAIAGERNRGTFARNYYYNCKVASSEVTPSGVGLGANDKTETSDIDGIRGLYAINLVSPVTLIRNASATLPGTNNKTYANGADINGQPFAYDGAAVSLGYSGTVPLDKSPVFQTTGGTIDGSTLTMPAANVTVGAALVKNELHLLDDADNGAAIAAAAASGKKFEVTLERRNLWKDGGWNTLCLPFDVDLTDGECPLNVSGVEARTLTAASIEGTTLNLTFGSTVTTLQAGVPYIIRWGQGQQLYITNPVFKGVTIDATDNSFDNGVSGDGRVRFIGTYKSTTFTAEDKSILFLGEGNNLYYPEAGATIGAQRAYFKIGNGAALARQLTAFNLSFGDGSEETGICPPSPLKGEHLSTPPSGGQGACWYSLDGQCLDAQPTKKGLYIHGGRKVVIP